MQEAAPAGHVTAAMHSANVKCPCSVALPSDTKNSFKIWNSSTVFHQTQNLYSALPQEGGEKEGKNLTQSKQVGSKQNCLNQASRIAS